jgi:hypothetical protein
VLKSVAEKKEEEERRRRRRRGAGSIEEVCEEI